MSEPVYIVALGASTPVGRDAPSSAAAVRAGVTGFTEHPFMVDTAGEPMRVALAPWLNLDECDGIARFEALLFPAMAQALAPLLAVPPEGPIALALGLPLPRPGVRPDLESSLRRSIGARFPKRFAGVATFETGHASGLVGMHAAYQKLGEGAFDACVIAGVESYLSPESLESIEASDQLHGAGPMNNAWGFIPGEAAGAVLLVRAGALERLKIDPLAQVMSVGKGFEKNGIKTEAVCLGEGLTEAFRDGLAGLPPDAKVTDVFCDMNGEPYRGDEFGFASLRTKESFVSSSDFVAPADCWGDVSAASGPLGLALATLAAKKKYAIGEYALVWASSESGERAAVLLASVIGGGS